LEEIIVREAGDAVAVEVAGKIARIEDEQIASRIIATGRFTAERTGLESPNESGASENGTFLADDSRRREDEVDRLQDGIFETRERCHWVLTLNGREKVREMDRCLRARHHQTLPMRHHLLEADLLAALGQEAGVAVLSGTAREGEPTFTMTETIAMVRPEAALKRRGGAGTGMIGIGLIGTWTRHATCATSAT
jgi:hypothetical protein